MDKDKTLKESPNQKFTIGLSVVTQCDETLTEHEIWEWLKEIFYGCDVGDVSVDSVEEVVPPPILAGPSPAGVDQDLLQALTGEVPRSDTGLSSVRHLLKSLTEMVPPPPDRHHGILFDSEGDGVLLLVQTPGSVTGTLLRLSAEDLEKSTEVIVTDIIDFLAKLPKI